MIEAPPTEPLVDTRRDFLKLLVAAQPVLLFATSLSVINRTPQGAPQIDSQTYPANCTPAFPFHFDFYLATNLLAVNYAKLSFFLRAFQRDVASVNTATSSASSASSSGSSSASSSGSSSASSSDTPSADHVHQLNYANAAVVFPMGLDAFLSLVVNGSSGNFATTGTSATHSHPIPHTHGILHTHGIPHTHDVTPTLQDGIFEGAVATGVTVKVNGVDRTAALGGGSGFTTNQTELALLLAWLNPGAWNTIDLTPSGLGRITGHLTVVSFIQSV